MLRQFAPYLDSDDSSFAGIWNAIELAKTAQKFMLPEGGRLYEDRSFRALDEAQALRLPFPCIALEYASDKSKAPRPGEVSSSKRIVFAREDKDAIVIAPVFWSDADSAWFPLPEVALPTTGYLSRDAARQDGWVAINCSLADKRIPLSDYEDELGALLCFLNALQCSNVHVERSPSKKSGKQAKSAFPFDDYYVLGVDIPAKSSSASLGGTHRSPREHLRRGHVRVLAPGRSIWVNAAIVGAGKGAGKITKDYNVK